MSFVSVSDNGREPGFNSCWLWSTEAASDSDTSSECVFLSEELSSNEGGGGTSSRMEVLLDEGSPNSS